MLELIQGVQGHLVVSTERNRTGPPQRATTTHSQEEAHHDYPNRHQVRQHALLRNELERQGFSAYRATQLASNALNGTHTQRTLEDFQRLGVNLQLVGTNASDILQALTD
ncbi:hypothetical protein N836_31545 [Leptolyngbya sp. Heron Island J]|uniref:hypothetical protein n=1 Tax=Leptolyngbya sp. Heron Island J TaxID=1385935 RepID=UPI0003B97AE6|nr:hypothetical protein [Leptolyngbya sp. Heron Island J]ESA38476.1 hypothetical protein N836_31545 [Leptolyngbya sp. Heron Island J]